MLYLLEVVSSQLWKHSEAGLPAVKETEGGISALGGGRKKKKVGPDDFSSPFGLWSSGACYSIPDADYTDGFINHTKLNY